MSRVGRLKLLPGDLAPGDGKSAAADMSCFTFARVNTPGNPLFEIGYDRLWLEFGAKAEVEQRDVLMRRLAWNPREPVGGYSMLYEMIVVLAGDRFAAVRDQTAIVARDTDQNQAVVHLSHVLVDPQWRRSGVAGWLRAMPIQTARLCLEQCGLPTHSPVTLVAEMEHPDHAHPERMIRLQAYEKSGYRKIDPAAVPYAQPDFRAADVIDAAGGPAPIPMCLMLRRVGRESEDAVNGREVRNIAGCLYHMYGREFRKQDMAPLLRRLDDYPAADAMVKLLPPTA
jgi:hypothetical protein